MKKKVLIHLGPHKTGTTAIQRWLQENSNFLEERGVCFIHSKVTHRAASLIAAERYLEAEEVLLSIKTEMQDGQSDTIILSQEDFSGSLPGRVKRREVYPRLTKNVRLLSRWFSDFDRKFVFFIRDEHAWLRSCYHQNLRHRTRFFSYEDFAASVDRPVDLHAKIDKVTSALGESLCAVDYCSDAEGGVKALLRVAGIGVENLPSPVARENRSPSNSAVQAMERVNKLSEYPATAWFSKRVIEDENLNADGEYGNNLARAALPDLFRRAKERFPTQTADDILPSSSTDLSVLADRIIPMALEPVTASRSDIHDQAALLRYQLRGKSELSWLNALVISYLRRDTPHTGKARGLFHRIWAEHGAMLVNELSTRWLISTLQTFLDHGESEHQRIIGAAGFFYANLIKIYEGERSIEGLDQGGTISAGTPQTANLFRGLDRYKVGGTDLLLNTNAIALDIASRDHTAGLVMMEFILRVQNSGNVFTRMDRTRKLLDYHVPGFEDTWSFFIEPK